MKITLAFGLAAVACAAAAGDILISSGETYLVDSSSADFAARTNELNTADAVRLESGGTIEFNLAAGVEVTIRRPVAGRVDGKSTNASLVKKGAGRLNLYAPFTEDKDFYLAYDIQGGSVYLPQDYAEDRSLSIRDLTLADGTLFMAQNRGILNVAAINGSGTLKVPCWLTVTGAGRMDGVLDCDNEVTVRGRLHLTNPGNKIPNGVKTQRFYETHIGEIGFASPASIGGSNDLRTDKWGGDYVYIGSGGDLFTQRIDIRNRQRDDIAISRGSVLNAGAHGGAEFSGGVRFAYGGYGYPEGTPGVWPFRLDGSNTVNEAVFSGKIEEAVSANDGAYVFYLVKRGSGIWHLKHNRSSTWSGPLAVEEGTFRFNSLAEAGENCALGLGTNLFKPTWTNIYEECGYAVLLGGVDSLGNATEGTLEYTGADAASCTNRRIAVRTKGRLSTKSGSGPVDIAGVSAFEDGATLALDAPAGVTNTVRNISDGADGKTLSVVKDGAGDWRLRGDIDFSGTLKVNGGRLAVFNPNGRRYEWYRWTIRENGYASDAYSSYMNASGESWTSNSIEWRIVQFIAMNLYDADGECILKTSNMRHHEPTSAPSTLAPGEIAYDISRGSPTSSSLAGDLTVAFDGSPSTTFGGNTKAANCLFSKDDPSTWISYVWRMPPGAAEVRHFDFCNAKALNDTSGLGGRGAADWILEGSVDGNEWETVLSDANSTIWDRPWNWRSDGSGFVQDGDKSLGTRAGLAIASDITGRMADILPNVGAVSVAYGAELAVDGALTISNLCISADGVGAFTGVTFAENGLIDIGEMPYGTMIPATLGDAFGAERISGWTVRKDGDIRERARVKVVPGGFLACAPGFVLTIR